LAFFVDEMIYFLPKQPNKRKFGTRIQTVNSLHLFQSLSDLAFFSAFDQKAKKRDIKLFLSAKNPLSWKK